MLAGGTTYYVSPGGDDSSPGTSINQPWKTVERVNVQRLRPGDTILFQGGQSFDGGLYVSTKEGGSAAASIVFSNYGTGRATIRSGSVAGLEVSEVGFVAITNLNFIGGDSTNDTSGIYIHAGMADRVLSSFHIRNVDAQRYGREGVTLIASGDRASISDVKIERSSFHDNRWGGVNFTGIMAATPVNHNVLVDHVTVYNCPGIQTDGFVTGNGIYLANVSDARVQRCVVYNNGTNGVAPVGIWSAGSTRVVFQYNESYGNKTASATDGGGFDFDWDVTDSVMQYNYSHDNDGPGFMLGGGEHTNTGNVIRYNVSENDARKNGKGSIYIWGRVLAASIYNNVVYHSATGNSASAALRATDAGGEIAGGVEINNNIFYSAGGAKLINLLDTIAASSNFHFAGNAYYSGADAFAIQWGSSNYGSLTSWRDATRQERTRTKLTGYQGNPRLINAGNGGTIGNADLLDQLIGYRLQKRSPLVDRGRGYPPGIGGAGDVPVTDFFGEPALLGSQIDIGVDELR